MCLTHPHVCTQIGTQADLLQGLSLYLYLRWLGCGAGRDGTVVWRWEAEKEAQTCHLTAGTVPIHLHLTSTKMKGQQNRDAKKMAVSSLPLCSLWLVFQNSQMLAREGWSEGDMCLSCVIFALLWKSMFQMSDLSVSLLCNFLPVCLSFFPSLHLFHLCTQLHSPPFCLSHYILSCAFLPVGLHVHVSDPNPGGLDRCHGPDSCGCRSYVGSGGSHLLHPLPSVRYPGEELAVLFQM